ncbi:hypothetical protein WA026_003088 [Henosepilachna vigintioctopunctata]|uniref:DNA/RNA non-specific endonuclease/pyrophosphatase/phosphodiesterase domain-containing protein n=1 Tax=Henosepilachna vigintioctopunctata TaxID=420089 RepID=A0AAW1TM64_9CUCU
MKFVSTCIFVLCSISQVYSKGCSLAISFDDERYLPVYVNNSAHEAQLALSHKGNIELNAGESVLLSCPNPKNTLKLTKTKSAMAECVGDETIKIWNEEEDYQSAICSKGLKGVAMRTNEDCGGGEGNIIKLGFPQERKEFLSTIEVCHDINNSVTLYTVHILYGSEIKYASKESYRPSFSTDELAPDVPAKTAYKKVTQKVVFRKLLGSTKLAKKYVNAKSFLVTGHLAPDADFLFASWQFSTYFYVNAIPQWQAINAGNWKRLENLVRESAAAYNENIMVYTGTYGVLSLPDVNDVSTEIYLSKDKLPVPKFVYKILYSEESKQGIAFVSVNNPFLTELDKSDRLCTDICNDYGWGDESWNDGEKGFIYCCNAHKLLKSILTGPNIRIRGILKPPKSSTLFQKLGSKVTSFINQIG